MARCSAILRDGSGCRSVATTPEGMCSGCSRKAARAAEAAEVPAVIEAPAPVAAGQQRDVRAGLRATASDSLDDLTGFFSEAIRATKSVHGKCACGKSVSVVAPDWAARARVVELLLREGYGKAPDADTTASDVDELAARMRDDIYSLSDDELLVLATYGQPYVSASQRAREAAARILDAA